MFSNRWAPLLVAAFALVFFLPNFSSGQFRRRPTLEEMTQPQANIVRSAPVDVDGAQLIATTTQRIDRDRVEIRVLQSGKPVELFPHFHELVTATPSNRQTRLEELAGKSVTLIPSEKRETVAGAAGVSQSLLPWSTQADHWDIFTGVGGVGELTLADNIFKVRQVLLSSRKNPIEVHIDGQMHRLKPGQALLVL
jgi:hypothetical protein